MYDVEDYDECPDCTFELEVEGDKWEGTVTCTNPDCEYTSGWDNLPDLD